MVSPCFNPNYGRINVHLADEVKPICRRCEKGRFECLGYERERLWRNTITLPFDEPAYSNVEGSNMMMVELQRKVAVHGFNSRPPPQELSLVAFRENIYTAFMFTNHVWRSSGIGWLEHAAEGKVGQLSLDATQALSQANFGRSHHQPVIEVHGIALYGKCLSALAGQLTSVDQNPELIIPILVLLTHTVSNDWCL